nr:PKD domain-containing protein [Thermoproteota archaeon]
ICVSETPLPQPPTEMPTPTPIEEPVDNGTGATENETETETGADDNMGNTVEEDIDIINTDNNNSTDTDNNISTQTPPRNNYTQVDIPQNNTNSTFTPINNPPVAIATVSKQSVCEGDRVILDASNSHDPDDGDSIVSYSWSVEETDDEDLFPRIINRDSVKTAVETRNTLNSAAGSVGIELKVKDENGTMSNDFVSFMIEKCPPGGNDDNNNNNNNNNNNQGQQKATTKTTTIEATAECGIISETMNLAGQLAPKGIRIIGFFDQCQLDMASLLLNIPNDKDLKLIAGSIDFQNAPQARDNNDAVFVDMVKMRQLSSTQGLYKTSFEDPLVGKDLVTKQPKELSNINTIVLWNDDAKEAISFGSGSAVGMSISFEK